MSVVGAAGEAAPGLLRLVAPGEDCDAVPRLLTVPDGLVARLADGVGSSFSSGAFSSWRQATSGFEDASQWSKIGSRAPMLLTLYVAISIQASCSPVWPPNLE
jgi:hypothetical protein